MMKYLNLIEFLIAPIEQTENNLEAAAGSPTRSVRKFAEHKVVDWNLLRQSHEYLNDTFNLIQECILFQRIVKINCFTSFIPLEAVFRGTGSDSIFSSKQNYCLINNKKKLLVDVKTLNSLNKHKQINWSNSVNRLYPIQTLADGNCLVKLIIDSIWKFFFKMKIMFQCHAVMSYLCGMQDTNLALRETLKTFINNSEHTHELKFRCLTSRRAYYDSVSIGFDAETFEKVILKNCVASTSLRRFFRVRNYNHKQNFIYILLINK